MGWLCAADDAVSLQSINQSINLSHAPLVPAVHAKPQPRSVPDHSPAALVTQHTDRRQVVARLSSGEDPTHGCRATSLVSGDACSDPAHAGERLLCPMLTTVLFKSRSTGTHRVGQGIVATYFIFLSIITSFSGPLCPPSANVLLTVTVKFPNVLRTCSIMPLSLQAQKMAPQFTQIVCFIA